MSLLNNAHQDISESQLELTGVINLANLQSLEFYKARFTSSNRHEWLLGTGTGSVIQCLVEEGRSVSPHALGFLSYLQNV